MNYFNEPAYYKLSAKTKDFSRILEALKEEFDNIDKNQQKMDITENDGIRQIYEHNRNEAIEEVCMTLEWLRRNMSEWDEKIRTYFFTSWKLDHPSESSIKDSKRSSINIYW
jgi:hypothetical protein